MARSSREKSSTMQRTRKFRSSARLPETKSRLQRSFRRLGTILGFLVSLKPACDPISAIPPIPLRGRRARASCGSPQSPYAATGCPGADNRSGGVRQPQLSVALSARRLHPSSCDTGTWSDPAPISINRSTGSERRVTGSRQHGSEEAGTRRAFEVDWSGATLRQFCSPLHGANNVERYIHQHLDRRTPLSDGLNQKARSVQHRSGGLEGVPRV